MRRAALLGVLGFCLACLAPAAETRSAIPIEGPQLAFTLQTAHLPRHLDSLDDFGRVRIKGDLLTSGPAGEALQRLIRTHLPGRNFLQEGPVWSPDGQSLAVKLATHPVESVDGDIYILNRDGSGLRAVTDFGDVSAPVFSPDGRSLYFARPASRGRSAIWSVAVDGTGAHRVAAPIRGEVSLSSVSPSGDLALSRGICTDGPFPTPLRCQASVVLLSPATGALRPLLRRATAAAFSPDGTRIAYIRLTDHVIGLFHADQEPTGELFIADLVSGERLRLTRTAHAAEETPSWDPSGQRLVFARNKGRASRLVEINSDGTCETTLPGPSQRRRVLVGYSSPTWQPGPGREAGRIAC